MRASDPESLAPEAPRRARGQPEAPPSFLRRLRWTVLRALAMRLGGDERSLVTGTGMEIHELREYQPGDDVRQIDWNVTARADRPFVRVSYAERALDVWLLLDLSASVDWGTAECVKRDRAAEFASLAGLLLGGHGNRIGALLFAHRPLRFISPSSGRPHLLRLLAAVREAPRQATRGPTDLAAALAQAELVVRRRALVLVVTDFLVPEGWQAALGRLAQRHEVVAIRLRDPREAELPDIGLVTLEDPETGSQLVVDTSDRSLRERFARAAQAKAERIGAELARVGVDQLVLSTDAEIVPPLVQFLQSRQRRQTVRGNGAQRLVVARG